MQWDTFEHTYTEKTNDWFAAVILVAAALMAVAFLNKSYLAMTLIFIATVTVLLVTALRPALIRVEVRRDGILEGNVFHPYSSMDGFAIISYTPEHRLLLESNRRFMPLMVIHLPNEVDPEELHAELAQYLPHKDLHESLPHLLLEKLGF